MRQYGVESSSGSVRSRSLEGVTLAVGVAVISGFSVFINGYGVAAWKGTADPTTYTTLKNIVAAVVLVTIASIAAVRRTPSAPTRPRGALEWTALAGIAVFGGAVAFALFFEGLGRASSTQSAFIHKTLIVWVGILAVGMLRERVRIVHVAAIGLLIVGQLALVGGVGDVRFGVGEALVFAATIIWSLEVVLAKRLLSGVTPVTIAVARMAGGAIVLVAYGVASGGFAAIGPVTASQIGWVAVTGLALAAYVATWFAALSLAPAIDVTAILVGGAVITAVLNGLVSGAPFGSPFGLGLLTLGTAVAIVAARRGKRREGRARVGQWAPR